MTSLWGCQHDCLPRVSIVTPNTKIQDKLKLTKPT